jgi:ribosomal protein S18 acetylase RimI-like enzyme
MDIRRPDSVAAVVAASHLFDSPVDADVTARFLAAGDHHLLIAYEHDRPVGFVSGVETTHPDKGTEMFLYELGVDASVRNRGIGRALVRALAELASDRGCYGMFVLVDTGNEAALRTYGAAGGTRAGTEVMIEWDLSDGGVTRE